MDEYVYFANCSKHALGREKNLVLLSVYNLTIVFLSQLDRKKLSTKQQQTVFCCYPQVRVSNEISDDTVHLFFQCHLETEIIDEAQYF